MTTPFGTDRLITAWLEEQAPMREPDHLLESVVARVERTHRLPGWVLPERWLPMQTRARFGAIPRTAIVLVTLALLAVLLGAVALAGALPAPSPIPAPFGPAANGLIAYSQNGDIYFADVDGSNPRPVITGTEEDRFPAFSRDGRKVLFGRGPDGSVAVMVASLDGTDVTEVVRDVIWADSLPGDRQLAVTHVVNERTVLSIFDLDGSGTFRTLQIGNIEPMGWVAARPPDGKEVIFTGWAERGRPDRGLYGIGIDGSGLRTIGDLAPTDTVDDTDSTKATFSLQSPVLSPDGKTISFWNWETNPMRGALSEAYLHMRELDSGAELPVAIRSTNGWVGGSPHYSPDGAMMAFEGRDSITSENQEIWYGPIDGSTAAVPIGPIYSFTNRDSFDFSPDGTKVLLAQRPPGVSVLIDLATGATTPMDVVNGPWSWQRLALAN